MNIIRDIQQHVKAANTVEKLIYANVFFFVFSVLFPGFSTHWFALPSSYSELITRPWSIVTYAFIHMRFFHILSNLIILYFIGQLFLDFFTSKQLLVYYFLGLLTGGFLFVSYYAFSKSITGYSLIGSSAAVTAVLIGLATKIPHYAIRFRFIGSVELWVLAAIWIVLSAFTAAGINAGSGMAHLGGALIGFVLTSYLKEGTFLSNRLAFRFKKKPSPFKKVYKNKIKTKQSYRSKKENQQQVDAILEKISKSGYEALSKEEKAFLFNQKNH